MTDLSKLSTEELMRMRAAPASGVDLSALSTEELMQMRAKPESAVPTALRPAVGGLETVAAIGSGLAGGVAGGLAGVAQGAKNLFSPGMPAGDRVRQVGEMMTYQPRSQTGQETTEVVTYPFQKLAAGADYVGGRVADLTGSPAVGAAANTGIQMVVPPGIGKGAMMAGGAAKRGISNVGQMMGKADPPMAGVGAALTDVEMLRRQRAANLPVPVKLTKGEAGREFEQQRFEKETAKTSGPAGELLRDAQADKVGNIIKNFEYWVDESGAVAPDLITTGKTVDKALVKRLESAKAEIRGAYKKAEDAGELSQPVSVKPLVDFIAENQSAAKLAPVIAAAESELIRLGGATRAPDGSLIPGKMPLNDIENARKLIVRLSKVDETNGHYGKMANEVIDAMTEGQGGKLYADARKIYKNYAAEFKNQGAVRKLVTTKPGTSDRSVALEDVFEHSVLKGSNADTVNILRSLEKAGQEGLQGIAELRGATMNWMLDKTIGNAGRDIRGQPIPSFSKIDKAVRALDTDGKLDLLFGKEKAAQIRDLRDVIGDVQTAPPGVVNNSTTAAVLMEALGALATGRIPTATAKAISGVKQALGDRAALRRARESLADPLETPATTRGNQTLH